MMIGTDICVDVHTHLTDAKFNVSTLGDVIARAKLKSVRAALVVSESVADFEPVLRLQQLYPDFVLPCLGIHPIQKTGSVDERGIDVLRSVSWKDYEGVETSIESSSGSLAAIGEIGLDFSPRFCKTSETQRLVFSRQVKLAQSYELAVNVHSRSAGKHAVQLLREMDARKVLLHAFDGRASVALDGASRGFYFSVPASVCRDEQVQKLVKSLPLDRLMVETDSPAIAPVKGEVNEPANAAMSCELIAELKSVTLEHVKQITTENAVRVFPALTRLLDT